MSNIIENSKESKIQAALEGIEFSQILEDPDFANLIEIMHEFFDTEYAFITYFQNDTLYVTADKKFRPLEMPRNQTFCQYTIQSDDVMVIENALIDERFCDNSYVTTGKQFRFYAGAPLVIAPNVRIGTISVMDTKPRTFSEKEKSYLQRFAAQVVSLLKLHKIAEDASIQSRQLRVANLEAKQAKIAIDTMNDGLLVLDNQYRLIYANRSTCLFFNRGFDELSHKPLNEIIAPAFDENYQPVDFFKIPPLIALSEHRTNEQTLGFDCPTRGRVWVRVNATPFIQNDDFENIKIVTSFTDITQNKIHLEEMRKLTDEANAANAAKSSFLANMSHEIRTPLNGVIGVAAALALSPINEAQKEMVDLIIGSGRTLETLLSDILDFSKVEAGQINLENAPFALKDAVISTANLLRLRSDEKGIAFKVIIDENLSRTYIGDVVRIKQIIANLASNAIKFTSYGTVTLTVSQAKNGEGVEIIMSDTGIGMDELACKNIFDRFTQADNTITRRFGGTGLGLAITKGLVELMKGEISLQSTPNVGTTFKITLPLKAELSTTYHPPIIERPVFEDCDIIGRPKILLVEDHPMNQKVFGILCAPLDVDIHFAQNGLEGVEAYQNDVYDLVFMDMQMPVMDGMTATMKIREIEIAKNSHHTPIIMLTANAGEDNRKKAIESGADFHVTKPVTIDCLNEVIHKAMMLGEDEGDNIATIAAQ